MPRISRSFALAVLREAVVVGLGAVLAVLVIGQVPQLREFMQRAVCG